MQCVITCYQIKGVRFLHTATGAQKKRTSQIHGTCCFLLGLIPNDLTHRAPCFPDFPLRCLHLCSVSKVNREVSARLEKKNRTKLDFIANKNHCGWLLLKNIHWTPLLLWHNPNTCQQSTIQSSNKLQLSGSPQGSCEGERNCSLERSARLFPFVWSLPVKAGSRFQKPAETRVG